MNAVPVARDFSSDRFLRRSRFLLLAALVSAGAGYLAARADAPAAHVAAVSQSGAVSGPGVTAPQSPPPLPPAWFVVASPNPGAPPAADELRGVSCASPSDCVAVGERSPGPSGTTSPLIERWGTTGWSVVPAAPGAPGAPLVAVSCVSPAECVAVGPSDADGQSATELITGSLSSLVPNPPGELTAVSCVPSGMCMAVGFATSGHAPLAERFDGSSWTATTLPLAGATGDFDSLTGVSCVTASDCVAVGASGGPGGVASRTLVESYDGTSWTVVPSPNVGPASADDGLSGVSCLSASDCVAVGSASAAGGFSSTLVETFDGSSWSVVPSPDAPVARADDVLSAVSCAASSDCVAVGQLVVPGGGIGRTLVESVDGSGWSLSPSPSPGAPAQDSYLDGVACGTGGGCVAVGALEPPTGSGATLAEVR